ncbi:MAG: hypothetical protein EOM21_20240, partial [Gammaproteobacteria bacterium]|nr:hypothetical protein [Gammaproteobacteria bacterium]
MHPTDTTETTKNPTQPRLDWRLLQIRDASEIWCTNRDTTQVAAVEGGWLFRFRHYDGSLPAMSTQALTFVPDPEHRWSPEQTKPRWERRKRPANYRITPSRFRSSIFRLWGSSAATASGD